MQRALAIAILACVAGLGGCSDDGNTTCGPGSAAADGLALAAGSAMTTFGTISASANGDCPVPGTPTGVDSLTLMGMQVGSAGFVTLCIPRPDELTSGPQSLGLDQVGGEVRIVDLDADANSCTYALDRTTPPTGTVTASGVCNNGTNSAGFALSFAGTVSLTQTCGTAVATVSATLTGAVAVTAATN